MQYHKIKVFKCNVSIHSSEKHKLLISFGCVVYSVIASFRHTGWCILSAGNHTASCLFWRVLFSLLVEVSSFQSSRWSKCCSDKTFPIRFLYLSPTFSCPSDMHLWVKDTVFTFFTWIKFHHKKGILFVNICECEVFIAVNRQLLKLQIPFLSSKNLLLTDTFSKSQLLLSNKIIF